MAILLGKEISLNRRSTQKDLEFLTQRIVSKLSSSFPALSHSMSNTNYSAAAYSKIREFLFQGLVTGDYLCFIMYEEKLPRVLTERENYSQMMDALADFILDNFVSTRNAPGSEIELVLDNMKFRKLCTALNSIIWQILDRINNPTATEELKKSLFWFMKPFTTTSFFEELLKANENQRTLAITIAENLDDFITGFDALTEIMNQILADQTNLIYALLTIKFLSHPKVIDIIDSGNFLALIRVIKNCINGMDDATSGKKTPGFLDLRYFKPSEWDTIIVNGVLFVKLLELEGISKSQIVVLNTESVPVVSNNGGAGLIYMNPSDYINLFIGSVRVSTRIGENFSIGFVPDVLRKNDDGPRNYVLTIPSYVCELTPAALASLNDMGIVTGPLLVNYYHHVDVAMGLAHESSHVRYKSFEIAAGGDAAPNLNSRTDTIPLQTLQTIVNKLYKSSYNPIAPEISEPRLFIADRPGKRPILAAEISNEQDKLSRVVYLHTPIDAINYMFGRFASPVLDILNILEDIRIEHLFSLDFGIETTIPTGLRVTKIYHLSKRLERFCIDSQPVQNDLTEIQAVPRILEAVLLKLFYSSLSEQALADLSIEKRTICAEISSTCIAKVDQHVAMWKNREHAALVDELYAIGMQSLCSEDGVWNPDNDNSNRTMLASMYMMLLIYQRLNFGQIPPEQFGTENGKSMSSGLILPVIPNSGHHVGAGSLADNSITVNGNNSDNDSGTGNNNRLPGHPKGLSPPDKEESANVVRELSVIMVNSFGNGNGNGNACQIVNNHNVRIQIPEGGVTVPCNPMALKIPVPAAGNIGYVPARRGLRGPPSANISRGSRRIKVKLMPVEKAESASRLQGDVFVTILLDCSGSTEPIKEKLAELAGSFAMTLAGLSGGQRTFHCSVMGYYSSEQRTVVDILKSPVESAVRVPQVREGNLEGPAIRGALEASRIIETQTLGRPGNTRLLIMIGDFYQVYDGTLFSSLPNVDYSEGSYDIAHALAELSQSDGLAVLINMRSSPDSKMSDIERRMAESGLASAPAQMAALEELINRMAGKQFARTVCIGTKGYLEELKKFFQEFLVAVADRTV